MDNEVAFPVLPSKNIWPCQVLFSHGWNELWAFELCDVHRQDLGGRPAFAVEASMYQFTLISSLFQFHYDMKYLQIKKFSPHKRLLRVVSWVLSGFVAGYSPPVFFLNALLLLHLWNWVPSTDHVLYLSTRHLQWSGPVLIQGEPSYHQDERPPIHCYSGRCLGLPGARVPSHRRERGTSLCQVSRWQTHRRCICVIFLWRICTECT